ncbi:nucleotide exchange factor GrpE [Spiroplasma culicicola]|uniref:Protein GrpE n=1 Tax=Spiroplasma culicicola AES-1 TaxID=1276246 RepID=W6A6W6_9MOLU|nr:nucleotide exchange factor GrpE [Spiroplasma culicicola]AHI52711.1 molecular chaperone GrpE (heat shock protein) [Spiroplasma culicicola AES-1]
MANKEEQNNILNLFEIIKKELNVEPTKEGEEKQELSNIEKLELEFANLIDQNSKLEEARLIAVADTQNTVKRFQNEAVLVRKYGGERLATELIPAIDMFRSVLKSTPDNPEIKNYLMGFEMIINQIDQALNNAGVSMITTNLGDDLNPEIHNAIEQVESNDFTTGKIVAVISNGYKLHDRVIKHAAVKVAK